jgi:hypothetical protein
MAFIPDSIPSSKIGLEQSLDTIGQNVYNAHNIYKIKLCSKVFFEYHLQNCPFHCSKCLFDALEEDDSALTRAKGVLHPFTFHALSKLCRDYIYLISIDLMSFVITHLRLSFVHTLFLKNCSAGHLHYFCRG